MPLGIVEAFEKALCIEVNGGRDGPVENGELPLNDGRAVGGATRSFAGTSGFEGADEKTV